MALVLADRVKETSTTTGTGTLTLAGAAIGFQSFAVIGNGNTCYYTITNQAVPAEWEVGIGTYTASGTTLARTTILASSNAGAAVTLSAGTKDVFVTYPAEKAVFLDAGDALTPDVASVSILTNTTPAIFAKDDNLTSWTYSNKSFSVTAQETVPSGLFFSPDGTRMYIIGSTGDDVTQYALSTAWDVTTSTLVQTSATVGDTSPAGLFFRSDGLKMYITGSTNDSVREFNLSVAWDVSTIVFVQEFLVSGQDLTPQDLWFKPDGLKMYVVGSSNDRVYEYNLSTAWNISTATFLQFFSVAAQETGPVAVNFNSDGTRMYVLGTTGLDINRYTLSTAWNISTAVFYNNFYIGFQETGPAGLFVDASNDVAYVVGSTADAVFQYATSTDGIQLTSAAGLFVEGGLYTNKNLVVTASARIDGGLSVSGSISGPVVATTISANSTINLAGTTTSVTSLGTAATTGTTTVGGTAQTGVITVGQSTVAQTLNIATGATATATTKAVNIGTAGLSGSTTNIVIGSAVSGSTTAVTAYGTTSLGGAPGAESLRATPVASAVNYLNVQGATTTNDPTITAAGTDTNIDVQIVPKGTGSTYSPNFAASNGIMLNNATINTSYTLPTGYNALSAGPVTIASGVVITVPSGSVWAIV